MIIDRFFANSICFKNSKSLLSPKNPDSSTAFLLSTADAEALFTASKALQIFLDKTKSSFPPFAAKFGGSTTFTSSPPTCRARTSSSGEGVFPKCFETASFSASSVQDAVTNRGVSGKTVSLVCPLLSVTRTSCCSIPLQTRKKKDEIETSKLWSENFLRVSPTP